MKKLVLAITGASGSIYPQTILNTLLKNQHNPTCSEVESLGIVITDNARMVWKHELGVDFSIPEYDRAFADKVKLFQPADFMAPFASGSAGFDAMIICPCSMGTLGRIASGISSGLITRAADVMLKERKKLILVIRETPYNLIHINNMKTATEAGAIVMPASPSFYAGTAGGFYASSVTNRALQLAGLELDTFRWGETK